MEDSMRVLSNFFVVVQLAAFNKNGTLQQIIAYIYLK